MIFAIAIVGASGIGKTRIAVGLIESLSSRGYSVAAVKHAAHGHDLDRPGSDSERMLAAGAGEVRVVSPGKVSTVQRTAVPEPSVEDLLEQWAPDCDFLVVEGFKHSALPKILVEGGDVTVDALTNVVALVGEGGQDAGLPVRRFTFNEIEPLAEMLVSRLQEKESPPQTASLFVDGGRVMLNRFPGAALAGVVTGFMSALRNVPSAQRDIKVTIRFLRPRGPK